MRRPSLLVCAIAVACAFPRIAASQPLPAASFREDVRCIDYSSAPAVNRKIGLDDALPETVVHTYANPASGRSMSGLARTFVTQAASIGGGPLLLPAPGAEASMTGSGCGEANAVAIWSWRIGSRSGAAPANARVPVIFSGSGDTSISDPNSIYIGASAIFDVDRTTDVGSVPLFRRDAVACGQPVNITLPCLYPDSFSDSLVIELLPGSTGTITVTARAEVGGGVRTNGLTAHAIVDPTVEIDPEASMLVAGELVPATELYEVQLSANVPEASSPVAAVAAVLVLATLRKRRQDWWHATGSEPAPRRALPITAPMARQRYARSPDP